MSKGKKRTPRSKAPVEIEPGERELFLDAFYLGEIRPEAKERVASLDDELEDSVLKASIAAETELFLQTIKEGIPRLSKEEPQRASSSYSRKSRGQRRGTPDARIDLHGMHSIDAYKVLQSFIAAELARGSKVLLIIHGKGSGVLRDTVWSLIDSHPDIVDYQEAPAKLGGAGALLIRIKRGQLGRRNF